MDTRFILNFREFLEYIEPQLQVGTIVNLAQNPKFGLRTSNVSGMIVQGGRQGQKNIRLPMGEYKITRANSINIFLSPVNDPSTEYQITKTELARTDPQAYNTLFPKPEAPTQKQGFFGRLFSRG